jgi:hypothetical protein
LLEKVGTRFMWGRIQIRICTPNNGWKNESTEDSAKNALMPRILITVLTEYTVPVQLSLPVPWNKDTWALPFLLGNYSSIRWWTSQMCIQW